MKTGLMWIVFAAASATAGWYVYDNVPDRLYTYTPSGPEPVPGFSPLAQAGFGCGIAVVTLALLAGLAFLVRSAGRGQRGLILAAVTGWSLVGLLVALAWSLIDAKQTFVARPNVPGMHWVWARAGMLGLLWMCAVTAAPLALRRWWQTTRPTIHRSLLRPITFA